MRADFFANCVQEVWRVKDMGKHPEGGFERVRESAVGSCKYHMEVRKGKWHVPPEEHLCCNGDIRVAHTGCTLSLLYGSYVKARAGSLLRREFKVTNKCFTDLGSVGPHTVGEQRR